MSPQKMPSSNQNYKSIKAESCSRVDIVKDDSGACAVFTEQGSSASQVTAAKKKWPLLQVYQCVTDKQLMQYLPTLR